MNISNQFIFLLYNELFNNSNNSGNRFLIHSKKSKPKPASKPKPSGCKIGHTIDGDFCIISPKQKAPLNEEIIDDCRESSGMLTHGVCKKRIDAHMTWNSKTKANVELNYENNKNIFNKKYGPFRLALKRVAPFRLAYISLAYSRLALVRSALVRSAPVRLAIVSLALVRLVPSRLALFSLASVRLAPTIFRPDRSKPDRFRRERSIPDKSKSSSC